MNKLFFRILVVLMSLSLIGIILVQVYWFDKSFENNEEQFKFHVKQVLGNVANKLQKYEAYTFYEKYNHVKDSIGKAPEKSDFLEFGYFQRDSRTNETIVYSNSIISEDYGITPSFFDKKLDSLRGLKNFSANRKTEVYSDGIDNSSIKQNSAPDVKIEKSGSLEFLNNAQFEIFFKDIAALRPIQERISNDLMQKMLSEELKEYGVKTPFEFNVYSNGLATKVKSENFKYEKASTYSIPIFIDNDGNNKYQLLITFPQKKKYLFSELIGICVLSIVFTLIIIIAYSSALSQLIKQRQISEIKTDFINNMTHEFKTPLATISLAVDALSNEKVLKDDSKLQYFRGIIKDENKRMNKHVETILQAATLERQELTLNKQKCSGHHIIQHVVDNYKLMLAEKQGSATLQLNARYDEIFVDEQHFTNLVNNLMDNAIK